MEEKLINLYNTVKQTSLGKFIGTHPKKIILITSFLYLYLQRRRSQQQKIEHEKKKKLLGLSESVNIYFFSFINQQVQKKKF